MKETSQSLPKAIDVKHLTVNYGKTPVLWDIGFTVPQGNIIGVIGPNGAGKSTLMKAILGLLPLLSGKVEIFGQPLKKVRERIAYVPQRGSVDWEFPITVKSLVAMGRYGRVGLFRRLRRADWSAAEHYIRLVGLEGFENRQINELSGGQQQRVFLARALLQESDIYFLDEPFAGIDVASEKVVIDILKKLKDEGKTIFVVHHDLNTVESYFTWTILLNLRLVAEGPVKEVFTPQNLAVTYGKNIALFDEAVRLSSIRSQGKNA